MAQNNFPIIGRIQIVNKIRNAVFVVVFKMAHQGNIVALMNRRTCRTLHFYIKTFVFQLPPQQICRGVAFARPQDQNGAEVSGLAAKAAPALTVPPHPFLKQLAYSYPAVPAKPANAFYKRHYPTH